MKTNDSPLRVLVVGAGSMGSSHARAYHALDDFEVAGIVAPSARRRSPLAAELGCPEYASFDEALAGTRPDAVCIASYPDTHYAYTKAAIERGAHVFVEKPLATTVEQAAALVELAQRAGRKIVVGYILRVHPAWTEFTNVARTLGKPLVMRMNLNQQSSGEAWETHKGLMKSMSPIVDCGVHYVDVMCQMTGARPVRVQAIGARLSDEIAADMYNYGQLQVVFEDGSIGWYEAGWGPMMSETAYFVKDVVGPLGSVSIVGSDDPRVRATQTEPPRAGTAGDSGRASADIDRHTKTNNLLVHRTGQPDRLIDMSGEPDHQALCVREQKFFADAIHQNHDLTDHLRDAVESLRIVLAADESVRTGRSVEIDR